MERSRFKKNIKNFCYWNGYSYILQVPWFKFKGTYLYARLYPIALAQQCNIATKDDIERKLGQQKPALKANFITMERMITGLQRILPYIM